MTKKILWFKKRTCIITGYKCKKMNAGSRAALLKIQPRIYNKCIKFCSENKKYILNPVLTRLNLKDTKAFTILIFNQNLAGNTILAIWKLIFCFTDKNYQSSDKL